MAWDKTEIRRHRAARMEIASVFSDAEIAEAIGLTPAGLAQMKITPEYRDIILSLKHGVIQSMDASLGEDLQALRDKLRANLPAAMDTIVLAATQRKDMNLALKAADIMVAMDGRLAKVTRVGLPAQEQGGVSSGLTKDDNDIVDAMTQALSARAAKEQSKVETIH